MSNTKLGRLLAGAGKPKVVGLSDFHYAVMMQDEEGAIQYGPIKPMKGARGISVTAITGGDAYYEDDVMTDNFQEVTGATVEITLSSLLPAEYADIMGQSLHDSMIVDNILAVPPFVAMGYKRLLSAPNEDGSPAYRYIWLYKIKFSIPDESGTTKEASKVPQEPVLRGTSMPLAGMLEDTSGKKGRFWRAQGGDEFEGWTEEKSEGWFEAIQGISPPATILPPPTDPEEG